LLIFSDVLKSLFCIFQAVATPSDGPNATIADLKVCINTNIVQDGNPWLGVCSVIRKL
jgi:hypothetical protein